MIDHEQLEKLVRAKHQGVLRDVSHLAFAITGTLSLPRRDVVALITVCGGRVSTTLSPGVDILVRGDHLGAAGPSIKEKEALRRGALLMNEEQLVMMLLDEEKLADAERR